MKRLGLAILAVLSLSASARAQDLKDRFNIRLSLTGMYLTEQQTALPMGVGREAQVASPFELGYGDLRAVIDARRLPGNFELHLDGRVRLTGEYSTDAATQGADQITARGYLGGKEYELRQAWTRRRGEQWDFALGRMIVSEADALRLDGARLWWRMKKHWDASLYAGAYPDPFSRSLTTDYAGGIAAAGGLDTSYTYDKIWGSVSVNGSYLGGNNAGGPLPAGTVGMGAVTGNPQTEAPRIWITWTDYVRLVSWLDLFTDLVLDAYGSGGTQLTRLDVLATVRLGKHVTFKAGYDHLSALAIEMWLTRLLQSRPDHLANTIENNLVVDRTARDEARGDLDISFGKASIFGEGRFRRRAMVSLTDDPQFVATGQQVVPGIAWDATVGLRDRGSVLGVRAGLWGMWLNDYQARSILAGLELGRSFLDERLSIDLAFLYAKTNDALALTPLSACTPNLVPATLQSCYGTRDGAEYEFGATITTMPTAHWYALLDYRLVADATSGNLAAGAGTMTPPNPPLPAQPQILTHMILLRIEARY